MQAGLAVVLLVVSVGIAASIGAQITNNLSTATSAGIAKSAIDNATQGIGNFASLIPVIGLIGAAGLVIFLLVGALGGGEMGR